MIQAIACRHAFSSRIYKHLRQKILKNRALVGTIVVHEKDLEPLAKLVHELAADPAGRDKLVVVARDGDRNKSAVALRDSFDESCAFCTDGASVGRVLDVAALEDLAVNCPQCSSDSELGVRRVRVLARLERLGDQGFDLGVRKGRHGWCLLLRTGDECVEWGMQRWGARKKLRTASNQNNGWLSGKTEYRGKLRGGIAVTDLHLYHWTPCSHLYL